LSPLSKWHWTRSVLSSFLLFSLNVIMSGDIIMTLFHADTMLFTNNQRELANQQVLHNDRQISIMSVSPSFEIQRSSRLFAFLLLLVVLRWWLARVLFDCYLIEEERSDFFRAHLEVENKRIFSQWKKICIANLSTTTISFRKEQVICLLVFFVSCLTSHYDESSLISLVDHISISFLRHTVSLSLSLARPPASSLI
jgi:hypothetical protein